MNRFVGKIVLVLLLVLFVHFYLHSQPPPPPGEHGSGQNENPFQQAPIGSGLLILSAMAVAYGGKQYLKSRKHQNP